MGSKGTQRRPSTGRSGKAAKLPRSIAAIPSDAQFVLRALVLWQEARKPGSAVAGALQSLRAQLACLGYKPRCLPKAGLGSAVVEDAHLGPNGHAVGSQKAPAVSGSAAAADATEGQAHRAGQDQASWAQRLRGSPDARTVLQCLRTFFPLSDPFNVLVSEWFPPSIGGHLGWDGTVARAQHLVGYLVAFNMDQEDVGAVIKDSMKEPLRDPVYVAANLPIVLTFTAFDSMFSHRLAGAKDVAEVRATYRQCKRATITAGWKEELRDPARYLRVSGSLPREHADELLNDLYASLPTTDQPDEASPLDFLKPRVAPKRPPRGNWWRDADRLIERWEEQFIQRDKGDQDFESGKRVKAMDTLLTMVRDTLLTTT